MAIKLNHNNCLVIVLAIIFAFLAVVYITRYPLEQQLTKITQDIAAAEIAAIEDESAAAINQKLGGIDTVNADNLLTGVRGTQAQPLVFQTRQLGRLPSKLPNNGGHGQTQLDARESVWVDYSGGQPFPPSSLNSSNNITEGFVSNNDNDNGNASNNTQNEDKAVSSSVGVANGEVTPKLQLFYRMSCGHTQAFLPVWYEVVAALPLRSGSVRYEEINCEDATNACASSGIDGVPTMRLVTYNSDGSEANVEEYPGARTFEDIKDWLSTRGIGLVKRMKVNMAAADNAIDLDVTASVEPVDNGEKETFVGDQILDATGNLRRKHDQAYLDAAAIDDHGHYHDVTDGCYDATFSRCQPNSQNPGFQIFTHRGQWGCVRPEPGSGINTSFDAAFTVANQYLNTLPPKQRKNHGGVHSDYDGNVDNGEESKETRQARMNKCANKYARELRGFGLCDLKNLNGKYVIPDEVRRGRLRVPVDNMSADEYENASMAALAIYGACGAPTA